jgi:Spy/CpxP family protein refolding chaperone
MRLKNLEMAELMDSDKPDEGKIRAKAKEISALREKMYMQGVEQGLTMKKLITPEQEQKLREVMQEKHSELTPEAPEMMFGMGPEMMGPGPEFGSFLPPMPDAPEPPEGLE